MVEQGKSFKYWFDGLKISGADAENDPYADAYESADEILAVSMNEQEMQTLWKTMQDLSSIAGHGRFSIDLHDENFMLGSDGHIVISDPFFSGWDKREI
jgi:hypothetical protein